MSWYKNTLQKYRKEITQSAVASFVLSLVFLFYTWHLGNIFVWQPISLIEQPSIFARVFYSSLVFIGPGRYLYHKLKFYKILHDVVVKGFGMWGLYNLIKTAVWAIMFYATYLVVGIVIEMFNTLASILVNIFNLVLYLSPTLGLFVFLTIFISYIYGRAIEEPVVLDLEHK